MAKVVSFNRDAPARKGMPLPWDYQFGVQLRAEYITFAPHRESENFRLTASNGLEAFAREFTDKDAVISWLRDELRYPEEEAAHYCVEATQGKTVRLIVCLIDSDYALSVLTNLEFHLLALTSLMANKRQ